jgi:hypothetical protein
MTMGNDSHQDVPVKSATQEAQDLSNVLCELKFSAIRSANMKYRQMNEAGGFTQTIKNGSVVFLFRAWGWDQRGGNGRRLLDYCGEPQFDVKNNKGHFGD